MRFVKTSDEVRNIQAIYARPHFMAARSLTVIFETTPEAVQALLPPPLEPTPEPLPAYFTYTIQPGDSIASIAAAFGISTNYIFWNNPEVSDGADFVISGQELLIPSVDGIIYRVKLGDTLSDITTFYKISIQDVISFGPNRLTSADSVIEGTTLVLP
ncbi:MAG: LysM peptidoglycan-binding domain-containing protein, partial [Chloroflexi bacterium]|nr:LysM peptidoglycan-binding domain-containing protein [Chloroflexota bacterium]